MRIRFFLAFAAFLVAASLGMAQPVKLKIMGGRPVVESVFVNGQGPYRFIVDTGAQTNEIDAKIARKLGLAPMFQVDVETVAGPSRLAGGRVGRVLVGEAEATDQEFLFSPLDGVHALFPTVQGVLGQEFLRRFDYTINFRGHELRLGEPAPAGVAVPIRWDHGVIAIATSEGQLVLDSGTDTLVLFRTAPKAQAREMLDGGGLMASVSVGRAPEVKIGEQKYRPAQAVFQPYTAGGREGLLPASLFGEIYVSSSEGYVILNPAHPIARALRIPK